MENPVTIGDAVLYLGDCREILPTLGRVDAVVTDPPYGMEFKSNHRAEKYDDIANDTDAALLRYACRVFADHSKYIFCRWNNLVQLHKQPKSLITWVKNNWSMGDLNGEHARQTECILFYPGAKHSFPRGRPRDVIHAARSGNEHHSSEKPVDLMAQIVEWTAGCVVDPFMGSGSTGVACAKLGRPFIGIEIDPKYFDVACRRLEDATRQSDMFLAKPAWADMWSKPFDFSQEPKGNPG